jgi:hypothetical protein
MLVAAKLICVCMVPVADQWVCSAVQGVAVPVKGVTQAVQLQASVHATCALGIGKRCAALPSYM